MAAPNELVQQYDNWNARINLLRSRGYNPAPALEVGTQDLKRIYQGGTPRSTQDITDQLAAAYTGAAQVTPKPPSTGLGSLLGNAVKDFGSVITNLPGAVIHEAGQIVNPSDWVKLAGEIAHPTATAAAEGNPLKGQFDFPDAARYLQQLPIIGGLIPGMWTLSSSTKQKEQHPLVSLLDVLPFVSAGSSAVGGFAERAGATDAASAAGKLSEAAAHPLGSIVGKAAEGATTDVTAGTWQDSLVNGKLAQAGLRASGVSARAAAYLDAHPNFISEYAPKYQAVWRKYSQISRAKTRAANTELFQLAHEDGVLDKNMSMEDTARIGALASTYNPRYESPATNLTPTTIQDITQRWSEGPDILPTGDIQAFSNSPVDVVAEGPVSLSRNLAGKDAVPVRIRRGDVMFTDQPGVVIARNIIPDIVYDPRDLTPIRRYRQWAQEQAAKGLTHNPDRTRITADGRRVEDQAPLVRVPTGADKPDAIFSSDTGLGQKYNRWQAGERVVDRQTQRTVQSMSRLRAAEEKLHGRSGKLYHFGESNADFAQRPDGSVNILTVRDAITPVAEYFTHTTGSVARGPIADLVGEEGLFAKLTDALDNGDSRQAKSLLSQIARKMRTRAFQDQFGDNSHLYDYVNYIRDEMTNITQKGNLHGSAAREYRGQVEAAKKQLSRLSSVRKRVDTYQAEYWHSLDRTPEARFRSLADQHLRELASGEVRGRQQSALTVARALYQGDNLNAAIQSINQTTTEMLDRIESATRIPQLKEMVGSDAFKTMMAESVNDWRSLIDAGYDPVWLHSPDSDVQARIIAGRITPFTQSFIKPSFEKQTAFNLANGKMDLAVGVTDAVLSKWRSEASYEFIRWVTEDSGTAHSYHQMEQELRQSMAPAFPGDARGLNAAIQQEINRTTEPFQPESYMPSYKTRLTQGDHYVIDRTVAKGFRRLMTKDGLAINGVYNRAMNIWRVSVLTGPRHIVHVAAGGLAFMVGQHPEALTKALDSFRALRRGELPDEVTQGILEENPDVLWQAATGKWMGNSFMQSMGKRLGGMEHALTAFETFTSDWQRGMVYLSQVGRGATSEEALAAVYKTFVNMDALTPFERTVIRQVFPFWTFTRHALQYVLSYPSDHPMRAAILSALNNQLTEDQKSGEPGKLNSLFFLGNPDAAGNVSTVDFKNLNPFRSIGGIATMAGFLQGANPALQLVARGLGYDPIGGVPMIYQPLTYDAYSGTDKPTRPGLGVGNIAETFIPEVSVLDHFVGFTSQMRALKKYSPAGYRAALYNSLNLPFTYEQQNIYDIRAKSEHARYQNAQQAVAAAEQGNLSALDGYTYVPYQGYLLPAATVKAYLGQYANVPGVAPKAIVPTPKRRSVKRVL